jgi:hypothetical protein
MRSNWMRLVLAGGLSAGLLATGAACNKPAPQQATLPTHAAPTGPQPCAVGDLTFNRGEADSAKFQDSTTIELTNSSAASCTLKGYAGVQLNGPSGPASTVETSHAATAAALTLKPKDTALIQLIWNKYEGQGDTCPPFVTSVTVTLPDGGGSKDIDWYGGVDGSVCGGKMDVYPFRMK